MTPLTKKKFTLRPQSRQVCDINSFYAERSLEEITENNNHSTNTYITCCHLLRLRSVRERRMSMKLCWMIMKQKYSTPSLS